MINTAELEQYFPEPNKPISEGPYTFKISLSQDDSEEIFIVNLKIKQGDNKEDHLIKFRLGLGKDPKRERSIHETHQPHFEIDVYKREKESFSAAIYFTFRDASDEKIMEYAKGTVVIISKIIQNFCNDHELNRRLIRKLIYDQAVKDDLSKFEPVLIEALYNCYKSSDMIVRQYGEVITIKTEHYLQKFLGVKDLEPLYLPLLERIRKEC